MDRETQFLQTVLDFRTAHKQTPQKARTVILDHRGDRTLVYRQITTRIPILAFTESVVKTILTPDAISQIEIEMLQCLRGFLRCIRITAQGGCRRNYPMIVGGHMRVIAFHGIAGGQSPASVAISFEALRILRAITVIDQYVIPVKVQVVSVSILQDYRT